MPSTSSRMPASLVVIRTDAGSRPAADASAGKVCRATSVAWPRRCRRDRSRGSRIGDAAGTAMTDGELVIASFESRGIYAYDMNGKLVWEKDLGDKSMRNEFGEGSTPVLYKNHLVVVWDHTKGSFVTALDKRTGQECLSIHRVAISHANNHSSVNARRIWSFIGLSR